MNNLHAGLPEDALPYAENLDNVWDGKTYEPTEDGPVRFCPGPTEGKRFTVSTRHADGTETGPNVYEARGGVLERVPDDLAEAA